MTEATDEGEKGMNEIKDMKKGAIEDGEKGMDEMKDMKKGLK